MALLVRERVRGIMCRSEAIAYELNDSIDRGAVKCRWDVGNYETDENGKCFLVCRLQRRMVMKKNQKQRQIFDWGWDAPPKQNIIHPLSQSVNVSHLPRHKTRNTQKKHSIIPGTTTYILL